MARMLDIRNIDQHAAYRFWIRTGLHALDFLWGMGVELNTGAKDLALEWRECLLKDIQSGVESIPQGWLDTFSAKRTNRTVPGDINATPFLIYQVEIPAVLVESSPDATALATVPEGPFLPTTTEEEFRLTRGVLAARMRQAGSDWNLAEANKRYIKEILARAFIVLKTKGEILFSPSEIRSLTAALLDTQKAQRLALGLSSENVGFPIKPQDQGGAQIPQIVVAITDKPLPKEDGA